MNTATTNTTELHDLADGRLVYDDTGDGTLVLATSSSQPASTWTPPPTACRPRRRSKRSRR